jgi:hypothetical protein
MLNGPNDDGEYDEERDGKFYDGTRTPVNLEDIDDRNAPASVLGAIYHGGHIIRAETNGSLIVERAIEILPEMVISDCSEDLNC